MAPAIQSTPGNSSTTIAKRTATADNQSPCAGEECLARAFCAEDSTANLCMYLPPRRTGKTCKCPPRRSTDNSSPALRRGQQPKTACSAQRTATEDSLLCAEDSTAERGGTANLCMYLPPRRTGKTAVAVLRRAGCLQWSLPGLLSAVLPVGEWGGSAQTEIRTFFNFGPLPRLLLPGGWFTWHACCGCCAQEQSHDPQTPLVKA